MSAVDELIQRNRDYARSCDGERWTDLPPRMRLIVVACCDHRADPAHVLGIGAGDAIVIRNAGGRVTPEVFNTLMVLATVAVVEGLDMAGLELVVMHHTDCGTGRLAGAEHRSLASQVLGVSPDDVPGRYLGEPDKAVTVDVELLRSDPRVPDVPIHGLVYDIENAEVRVVV